MKRKICCLLCFVLMLACSALITQCGKSDDSTTSGEGGIGGGSGIGGGGTESSPQTKTSISTSELVDAASRNADINLDGGIIIRPYQYNTSDNGATYSIVIKIQGPDYVRGITTYIFSANGIDADYYHYDKWQVIWAQNPQAGDQIRREKSISSLTNCRLLGCSFNKSQKDLGELRIKTPQNNEHKFIVQTHNPSIG